MPKYRNILTENLENFDEEIMSYEDFHEIFTRVLDRHAPIKTKKVRGNNVPFMTKAISKEICIDQNSKITLTKNLLRKIKGCRKTKELLCSSVNKREKKVLQQPGPKDI